MGLLSWRRSARGPDRAPATSAVRRPSHRSRLLGRASTTSYEPARSPIPPIGPSSLPSNHCCPRCHGWCHSTSMSRSSPGSPRSASSVRSAIPSRRPRRRGSSTGWPSCPLHRRLNRWRRRSGPPRCSGRPRPAADAGGPAGRVRRAGGQAKARVVENAPAPIGPTRLFRRSAGGRRVRRQRPNVGARAAWAARGGGRGRPGGGQPRSGARSRRRSRRFGPATAAAIDGDGG